MNINIEQLKRILEQSKKIDFEGLPPEQLYEICKFPVDEINVGEWWVPMNICCLGGCEFEYIVFEQKQAAYEYAYILTQLGIEIDCQSPCPDCYAEYLAQQI